jgi:hypothetical protein
MGAPRVPTAFKNALRTAFGGVFIASCGFNHGSAQT